MWGTTSSLLGAPVVEKMLRPIAVYIFLVIVLRVFGKRELAQLNPFDLVVLLSLSNTVQNAIIGNDNSLTGGLIGAFTLLAVNYLVVRFLFRHRRLDQIFEGKPMVLVDDGQIDQGGARQRTADPRGADDRIAPAGIRGPARRGALRARAGRDFFREGENSSDGRDPSRRSITAIGRAERQAGGAVRTEGYNIMRMRRNG